MSKIEMPVSELMGAFADGLRALIPCFSRARLGWRESDAHDPWDQVTIVLFRALVGSAVDFGIFSQPICSLAVYDARMTSYSQHSYVCNLNTNIPNAFICFCTDIEPFDHCLFAQLSEDGTVLSTYKTKVKEVAFAFVPRRKDGRLMPQAPTLTFEN